MWDEHNSDRNKADKLRTSTSLAGLCLSRKRTTPPSFPRASPHHLIASHTLHVFSVKFFSSSEKWRFAFISKAAGYSPCDKRESNRYGLENSPLCWKNGVLALEESLDTISDSRVTRARLGLPFVEELLTAVRWAQSLGRWLWSALYSFCSWQSWEVIFCITLQLLPVPA